MPSRDRNERISRAAQLRGVPASSNSKTPHKPHTSTDTGMEPLGLGSTFRESLAFGVCSIFIGCPDNSDKDREVVAEQDRAVFASICSARYAFLIRLFVNSCG